MCLMSSAPRQFVDEKNLCCWFRWPTSKWAEQIIINWNCYQRIGGAVGKLKDLVWRLKLYLLREWFQSEQAAAAAADLIISTLAKNGNPGQLIKLIVWIVCRLSQRHNNPRRSKRWNWFASIDFCSSLFTCILVFILGISPLHLHTPHPQICFFPSLNW